MIRLPVILTKEFLIDEYVNKGRLVEDICRSIGCHRDTIRNQLNKFGIERRAKPVRKPNPNSSRNKLSNTTVGQWRVGEAVWLSSANAADRLAYHCRCSCGNDKVVNASHLLDGVSTKCIVCLGTSSRKHKSVHWKGYEEIDVHYWDSMRRVAKKRGYEFDISIELAWDLYIKQNRQCALTGQFITMRSHYRDSTHTASLDRIGSSLGYIPGNIQWIHKDINRMKLAFNENRLQEICTSVCQLKNTNIEQNEWEPVPARYWRTVMRVAVSRNLALEITIQDAWNQFVTQQGRCAYTGEPLTHKRKDTAHNASLDRIDSTQGYARDNIQWVHEDVNRMKSNFSETYFLQMCRQIYDHARSTS